jgi:hypothetical protein
METIYDFVTVGIFAGLIVLFLQRSVTLTVSRDPLYHYLFAAVGCAISNYLGNEEFHFLAAAVIVATLFYIYLFLKPSGTQT